MFSQKNMIKARKELLIVGQNAVSFVVTWSARYMVKRNLPLVHHFKHSANKLKNTVTATYVMLGFIRLSLIRLG